jgi:UDP-N-acetylmuramoyl-L-alanyl-D-glutamate--2,6-diaminopimelate ligase
MPIIHTLKSYAPKPVRNLWHWGNAVLANVWYRYPSRELSVVGITGTNGKTTTTMLMTRVLEAAGHRTAMASTITFKIAAREWVNETKYTTRSPWALQRFIREAVAAGCTHLVLETSSHALDQYRVWGIHYSASAITNITREHFDYHGDFASYRRAKQQLFLQSTAGVVNTTIEDFEYFFTPNLQQKLSYGLDTGDIVATNREVTLAGSRFVVGADQYTLHIPGLFNIENALAVIGLSRLLQIPTSAVQSGLARVTNVSGRMESVPNVLGLDIIIDYAVTPDAFAKLYEAVRPHQIPGTRIIHVFGACGERDRGKRPQMTALAETSVDVIILTNEDPFYEDPQQILNDLESGLSSPELLRANGRYERIFDRRAALIRALQIAERGDIVLITGKGAETTMALGGERVPWQERAVVEAVLNSMQAK